MSRLPEIDPNIFEGKSFDERVKIRKELIAKYGTSLPGQDHENRPILGNKASVKDASGKILPPKGDPKAFEKLNFDERIELRKKMISAYGSSLPDADEEKPKNKQKNTKGSEGINKQSFDERCKKRQLLLDIMNNQRVSKEKK
jgi:hypothetical protein